MGPDPEKFSENDDKTLLCYDQKKDSWTPLPPLPVKWFGLDQVDGKLVAVGGLKADEKATNNIYTLNFVQNGSLLSPLCPQQGVSLVSQSAMIVIGDYSAKGENGATICS